MVEIIGLIFSILCFILALFAFKKPENILNSRSWRNRLWIKIFGERGTIIFVRYIAAPICILFGIFLLLWAFS
ncbi:MAG: hypothetical protein GTN36_04170 [Candidatus Aenigmarchaeota archaeon]|nr:hypothetical protein [Candidatus Aenigmarchaeota archaeon]